MATYVTVGLTPGGTNTVQSGDLVSLGINMNTASNIVSDTFQLRIGNGTPALTNNLIYQGYDFYMNSSGVATDGFYTGKTLLGSGTGVTGPNSSGIINGSHSTQGTGGTNGNDSIGTINFQAWNTNNFSVYVPVNIGNFAALKQGGITPWSTPGTIAVNPAYSWVEIQAIPEPSAGALLVAGLAGSYILNRMTRGFKSMFRSDNRKSLDNKLG